MITFFVFIINYQMLFSFKFMLELNHVDYSRIMIMDNPSLMGHYSKLRIVDNYMY